MSRLRSEISPPKNKIEEVLYKYYPDLIAVDAYRLGGVWCIEYHFNRAIINTEPGICTLTEFLNRFGSCYVEQRKPKMIMI